MPVHRTRPDHRRWRTGLLAVATLLLGACHAPAVRTSASSSVPALLPEPASLELRGGYFPLRPHTALIVASGNAEAAGIAHRFAERLARTHGVQLDVRPFGGGDARDAIVFELDPRDTRVPAGEGYELRVDAAGVRVLAREPRGLFYGGVTLGQLLAPSTGPGAAYRVPALRIVDAPRFAWRGAMLDSARHMQPVAFIERFIDAMAQLKLNTFHWHLSDDQGWRIEVASHPRLTGVGAWRRPAGAAGTDAQGRPVRYGGWYSQDEVRAIVRHAAERYVTIVPEIDLPAHSQAAIAAYPELGTPPGEKVVVSPDWGVHADIVNVDDATLRFYADVFGEIARLFPGPYVHVGGDEALKDRWKASPAVQARMHALGLADENALQGWFIAQLARVLAADGKRLVGWDEILDAGVPPSAVVMSWRGTKGAIAAARAGHDVVLAPSPDLYLDHLQGNGDDEPSGRPDLRTLADIYAFEPLPPGLDAQAARHVLGAQGNLWTEHMRTPAMVEHAAFPRLAALAEVLWSPPATHDWNGFVARLLPRMRQWKADGIAAAESAFEVRVDARKEGASVRVALADQAGLPIRYTLDGREPDAGAPRYREPLLLAAESVLRAAAFADGERAGPVALRALTRAGLRERTSTALAQCSGKLTLRLEDDAPASGPRAFFDVDLFDPCWQWKAAPLDGVTRIAVQVGQVPFNFQLGSDAAAIVPRPLPATPEGELRVLADGCTGEPLAVLPLAPARGQAALTTLGAALPARTGAHDLCFVFSGRGHDPLWTIERVQLLSAAD